jgi:4-amino-4-deoxy-L-arabinose transferase-like glycosyltransferase
MALQMSEDPFDYNTIPYGQELAASGRELPAYFRKPLYKYPPLFTMLTAVGVKFLSNDLFAVFLVPLLSGVLLIPLAYLLAVRVFGRPAALLAAVFVYLDPVTIACSQKIWIETTLVFFSVASLLFFVHGLCSSRGFWFVLSGLACGLAVNIKYPGIFLAGIFALYAFLHQRELFRNRSFLLCLFLPLLTLVPWVIWNVEVYGGNFFLEHFGMHIGLEHWASIGGNLAVFLVIGTAALIAGVFFKDRIKSFWAGYYDEESGKRLRNVLTVSFCIVFMAHILRALQFTHVPTNSWQYKMFINELPSFYIGRLIEFSLINLLGFLALFRKEPEPNRGRELVKIALLFYLLFYTLWGNFQSRYVMLGGVLLIVLGSQYCVRLFKAARRLPPGPARSCGTAAVVLGLAYILLKTVHLNQVFTFPNDFCYF